MLDMNGFAEMAREYGGTPADWYFYEVRAKIYTLHYYCGGRFKLSDKSTIEDVKTFVGCHMSAFFEPHIALSDFLTTVALVYHKALQGNSWAKEYYGVEL